MTRTSADSLDFVGRHLALGDPISVVRLGDGTRDILWREKGACRAEKIGYQGSAPTGFHLAPGEHPYVREELLGAATYRADGYYLAPLPGKWTRHVIAQGHSRDDLLNVNYMWKNVKQVWQVLFDAIGTRPVVVLAHESADWSSLPFNIQHHFKTGRNSYADRSTLESMKRYAAEHNNTVWLMAASVLVKMAVWQLHSINPTNSYLDVGSAFDPLVGLGKTRLYLRNQLKDKET